MDIGTAKPTAAERGDIPHHLIDIIDPWESASVAEYRARSLDAARAIAARGKRVLFVGGTALYLKALLRGLFEGPSADPALRSDLEREAERAGDAALHARLAAVDPKSAARLHPNDRRRVIRALEVIETTGRPLSALQAEHDRPAPPDVPVFALDRPRDELRARIDRRVIQMFEAGLIDEVRALLDAPRPLGAVAAQGVGYAEVIDLLAGRSSRDEAIERVQARTRQFAKRQRTWFRGLVEVRPWPVSGAEDPGETAAGLMARLAERSEGAVRDGGRA
jgi:tRNA dimethylallyltransferase